MSVQSHHYVMSDLHLGHKNILTYGQRPFKTIGEHDAHLIEQVWSLAGHEVLWILGDVAMDTKLLARLAGCPATLGLIGGNHDSFTLRHYTHVFTHIRGAAACNVKDMGPVILTHIPVHPSALYRWKYNIHGHDHRGDGTKDDKRYINVAMEHIDYKPIRIDELIRYHGGPHHE